MDETTIRRQVLALHGLRIDPEMEKYVFRRLSEAAQLASAVSARTIPVIGVDARTGMPLRSFVDLRTLQPPTAP